MKYENSKYDKDWALEQLQNIIKENGYKNISKKEFMKKGYTPSYSWYANHFESFANALNKLDYYTCYNKLIHKDEAINILKEEYHKNGDKISFNDMKKSDKIATPYIYYKIFNTKSWNEVLENCGLNLGCVTFTNEQELFIQDNYLHIRDEEIAKKLGLSESQIKQKRERMGLYIPDNLKKKVKSIWSNYSDEYFINKIHEFVNLHKRLPNKDDNELLSQINAPGISVYQSRFDKGFQTILGDLGYGYHRTPFTKEDEEFIKTNYKIMNDLEIANYLGRTKEAIKTKRTDLRCFVSEIVRYKFADDEVDEIKQMFNSGVELKVIADRFNTSESALIYRYEKFGLTKRSSVWTELEIKILKNIYSNNDWDYILSKIPNHNKDSILQKTSELKIKKEDYYWSEDDLDIATKMYLNKNTYKEISKALNNKFAEGSISTKLFKIGVVQSNKWTNEELDILFEYYEVNPEYVYENIKRDIVNIQQKAIKSGLSHPSMWRDSEDNYIIQNYKSMSDYEMAEYLGRTRRSVKWRRNHHLGLESYFYNTFGNNYIAKDGSVCLSFDELEIHNYLVDMNININKEVWYKHEFSWDNTNRRLDWVIIDHENKKWYIEYFGIYDTKRKENSMRKVYIKNTKKKVKDLYKAGLNDSCIFIFPSDLKNKTLDEIFGQYFNLDKKYKLA